MAVSILEVKKYLREKNHRERIHRQSLFKRAVKDFAGMIHSELAETFIYAVDVRSRRRLGEDYVLKHRDALEIVTR